MVMRLVCLGLAAALLATACDRDPRAVQHLDAVESPVAATGAAAPVRLLFAGDVMLGRRIAGVLETDAESVFEEVRHALRSADLAVANLEAPFGDTSLQDELRLIASPGAGQVLASAGFDAMAVANNHAGDAGPGSVDGTVRVLNDAGLHAIGVSRRDGPEVPVVEHGGVRVAMLAFDLTGQGPQPGDGAGVVHWDLATAEELVQDAQSAADIVTVGLHGGVEYLPAPDPSLVRAVEQLAGWGVDVVWSHGAHVPYEVAVLDPNGDGKVTIAAYGLGNFLFDQRIAGTEEGQILEVMAAADGPVAYRVGFVRHGDLRVTRPRWMVPAAPAAWLDGDWWSLSQNPVLAARSAVALDHRLDVGEITAGGHGDVDGDGGEEVVVAFLRDLRPTLVNQHLSAVDWTDGAGRSAHLGVYDAATLQQVWVAGSVPRPIVDLAVCDGGVAVRYGAFDGDETAVGSAWMWRDFGFVVAADVDGAASAGCADVDADGRTDPVLGAPGAS